MQISAVTLRIVQVMLGAIIAVVALFAGWWLLSLNTDTSEAQIKAQMTRMEVSASVYYSRLQFYDGVCEDIGVPSGYNCHDSSQAYAIEVQLKSGRYMCLDSQGFFSQTLISKGEGTSCRRY